MIKTTIETALESSLIARDALTAKSCKYADEQIALDELERAVAHLMSCLELLKNC